jgi:cytoskeletal protein RodZ
MRCALCGGQVVDNTCKNCGAAWGQAPRAGVTQGIWMPNKPPVTGRVMRRRRSLPGWFLAHKKISIALIVIVLVSIAASASQPQPKATPAQPTATTVSSTPNSVLAAPKATASSTPAPAATEIPTATPVPTSTPDARIKQRSDFRSFYGHLMGAENVCTDANSTAQKALTAAQADTTQMVGAYDSANAAHNACDSVSQMVVMMQVPDSLSSFKMQEALDASFARMQAFRDMWYDIAGALNANTVNLETQSTMQRHVKDAQNDLMVEAANVASAAITLGIKLEDIPPIAPS